MTTLIMEFSDVNASVLSNLIKIASEHGASVHIENDDDLSQKEFDLLAEGLKEALLIQKNKKKAIPASELWND